MMVPASTGSSVDVGDWLRSLGLPQYEAAFRAHSIEIDVLSELSEGDLESLGVPLGHRKRLLKAISVLGAIEQKHLEAERELQRMIDHIPVLAAAYRADGTRLYINQRVRESTDRTAARTGNWRRSRCIRMTSHRRTAHGADALRAGSRSSSRCGCAWPTAPTAGT
jgi:hypothetical protein